MKKKVLFITGSINQTSQMHQIAALLPDYDCWFSQLFTDSGTINTVINHTPLLNSTILAGRFKTNSEAYLAKNGLQIDYAAKRNLYDLVVYCTDVLVPMRMRNVKTIWVQEGMTDKPTVVTKLVKALNLPPFYSGNTALNGSSNLCDVYCAASEGYRRQFIQNGTDARKIVVTGIPNYDNIAQHLNNDFPHSGYVMVATTDMRETYRYENRSAFIRSAVEIANGRQLLFKLHPNENFERAIREIKQHAPEGTMIYTEGDTNKMIANCCELITQYSTVVYVGIALGKKVHSWFNVKQLEKLAPIQNGGTSAQTIANLCRKFIAHSGPKAGFDAQAAMVEEVRFEITEELVLN
ncbi:UDP-N-acetyl glucosamine 2-epimerase [Mucilaginibacter pedocola]|uniref:UDP-N-acetyl glucosamine 2-epimerase n=1 Tax=Mucilaginibacter pedocola TaxID=1792845 RepID=A0A1S9PFT8_9SPHI|nr:hypothetical protein [Mucilaginibacter pedocola]OOQ59812.1 hypothetical protein BC343_06610 [Mucilaginibacter pedocola]